MINPNYNTRLLLNNMYTKKKELCINLPLEEREELLASLQLLAPKLESFIRSFYESYRENQKLDLISKEFLFNKQSETLINMLSASLNLIISSIQQPLPLDDYLYILTTNYPNFSIMIRKKDLFIRSFMNAIIDSFKGNYYERLGNLWYEVIFKFVTSVNACLN